jgi:hypothetical protein
MLFQHYIGGMGVDTLNFDQVRADDPSVSSTEYVDVPRAALPNIEVTSTTYWWNRLPQLGESILGILRMPSIVLNDRIVQLKLSQTSPSTAVHSDTVGRSSNKPAQVLPKVTLIVTPPKDPAPAPISAGSTNGQYLLDWAGQYVHQGHDSYQVQ